MQLYTYTKNVLTAANSITLQLLELVTPCCNLLVGIMALFSINGRSGTPVLYAPLKIQKCNLKGVVLFFQCRHPPPKQAYWQEIDWKIVMLYCLDEEDNIFFATYFCGSFTYNLVTNIGLNWYAISNPYLRFAKLFYKSNGNAMPLSERRVADNRKKDP